MLAITLNTNQTETENERLLNCMNTKQFNYFRLPVSSLSRGGGYKANFLRSVIFLIFQHHQNIRYLLHITLIFDRCRRSTGVAAALCCGDTCQI